MNKTNQKVVAGLLVLLVVSGAAFAYTQNDQTDKKPTTSSRKSAVSTVTPTDVVKSFDKYKNRELIIKGRIVQIGKDHFVVSNEQKPSAIKLDFSKSGLNPTEYADSPTASGNDKYVPRPEVNITGKLVIDQQKQPPLFVVKSISE